MIRMKVYGSFVRQIRNIEIDLFSPQAKINYYDSKDRKNGGTIFTMILTSHNDVPLKWRRFERSLITWYGAKTVELLYEAAFTVSPDLPMPTIAFDDVAVKLRCDNSRN